MDSISELFNNFSNKFTIRELIHILEERAFGFLLFICALPNAIPIPVTIPGLSLIFGIPLLLMSLQIIFLKKPIFPEFILNKEIPVEFMKKSVKKLGPTIIKINKFSGNKFTHLDLWSIPVGIGLCIASIILCLPIPGMNLIPALGILICGLGMIEKDINFLIIGSALNYISLLMLSIIFLTGFNFFQKILELF